MNIPKISICVFIRDNNTCAFGLWESMAQLMPFADEFFVMDMGSTDGTFEILKDLASSNKKIRLEQSDWPVNPVTGVVDAGSFAVIPNQMIPECKNDLVWYYQADEIWHDNLLEILRKRFEDFDLNGFKGFSFWRYQLRENFQRIKWFPHIIHRIDVKERFNFTGDGMNTDRTNDAEMVSHFDNGFFMKWSDTYKDYPHLLPTHEMILDISSIGGFLENIVMKRSHHAPHWREGADVIPIDGQFHNLANWHAEQLRNPNWTRTSTPYEIPEVMKLHLGKTEYKVRQDLLERIKNG